jgi:SAM-dependent methyltransferase
MQQLKNHQDAQGRAMYDYLKGKAACEVVERDDGYVDATNAPAVYFSQYQDWPTHVKKAMRHARGRVLDIGCGAGRHSLYLQKKGLDVLGIDPSPLAIKVCKLRGLRKTKLMSISEISPKLGRFDTLLMLGNNFGLFESFDRARRLLARFHRITSERAGIIAETLDPYKNDEPAHFEYHKLNGRRGRMPGQVRLRVRYKKYATPWFDYLFVSKEEMIGLLQGTNWRVARFIDSDGPCYIAVLEKHSV